jgi:hypothetical protein
MERALFTSSHSWNAERIGAVAIYCSDGRWGEVFDEFCHESLKLPRYDRFAVPGGPLWLVMRDASLIIPRAAAHSQLEFLVETHGLEQVVLVGHYGCAYYTRLLNQDAEACLSAQEQDLLIAARTIREWFPEIQVRTFFAMRDGERLWFRTLSASAAELAALSPTVTVSP